VKALYTELFLPMVAGSRLELTTTRSESKISRQAYEHLYYLISQNLEIPLISNLGRTKSSFVAIGYALIAILLAQNQLALGQQESDDNSSVDSWTHIVKYNSNGDFLGRWGTDGTGDSQLVHPHGIAIDSSDNVYVVDEERQDVQKFDSNGTFILKLGSGGSGMGQFSNRLEDVAVDRSDNVYVVDRGNERIMKFDSNGTFLTSIGSQGTGDGQLKLPWGVAFDSSGRIYVTDRGNHRIQVFSPEGQFIAKFGGTEEQFPHLHGIAVDSSNNIYVTDERPLHEVQKLDHNGQIVEQWGGKGDAPGQFEYLHGIAVDSNGDVYVVDTQNTRIQKFSADGQFIKSWGSLGITGGQLMFPQDIAMDSEDNIYVTDHLFRHPTTGYVEDFIRDNNIDVEIPDADEE
jgi:DNA-binding beta-propeller fold protein YncE